MNDIYDIVRSVNHRNVLLSEVLRMALIYKMFSNNTTCLTILFVVVMFTTSKQRLQTNIKLLLFMTEGT